MLELGKLLPGVSNAEYRKYGAISKSDLDHVHRSPAHYQAYKANPPKSSQAQILGTAFHAILLEPDTWTSEFEIAEASTRTTKIYKDMAAANPDKMILLRKEMDQIAEMAATTIKHPTAKEMLSGTNEHSAVWIDPETEVTCKCRPDVYIPETKTIIDLKTARDASYKGFQSGLGKYRYHVQAAFYMDGVSAVTGNPVENFIFVAVEKEAPFGIGIYQLDSPSIELGRKLYKEDLLKYKEASRTDTWDCYPTEIQPMSAPDYLWNFNGDFED